MTFYELENLCKRKKKKRIILFLSLIFSIFLIGIIFFVFFKSNFEKKHNNHQIYHKKIMKKTILKNKIKKEEKKKEIKKAKKKENIFIKKDIKKNIKKDIKYLPIIDLNIKEVNKNENNKSVTKKSINENKNLEKNSSLIIKTNTLPSFQTCIELSKKYFKNKNYEEALKWAKFANLQDKKNPISWIMAARSLYKLGKKEEAIKLLKIYNSYYNNKKVNNLLKELNEK